MVGNTGGWFTLTNATRQLSASFLIASVMSDVPCAMISYCNRKHTKCLMKFALFKGLLAVLSIEYSFQFIVNYNSNSTCSQTLDNNNDILLIQLFGS